MTTTNIYDSRPAPDALAARCKRDKIDPDALVEVVAPIRHYAIRCFGLPTTAVEFDGKETMNVPAFILYSVRRDGKVSNGWGLRHTAKTMLEIGGIAQ